MSKGMVDAAISGAFLRPGIIYFFADHRYVRFDRANNRVDDGYPLNISNWNFPFVFLSGIDAAINGDGKYKGKAYFFKEKHYVRYDWAADRVDAGYPLEVGKWNLSAPFLSGIDAALNGDGKYKGKAYFFKDDLYARYDWATERVDPGYPMNVSKWNLPAPFLVGIDAALNGDGSFKGKAYFFKDDLYVRYDWATDRVDDGYPRSIAEFWPGLDQFHVLTDDVILRSAKSARDAAMFAAAIELRALENELTTASFLRPNKTAKAVQRWLLVQFGTDEFQRAVSRALAIVERTIDIKTTFRIDRSQKEEYASVGGIGDPSGGIYVYDRFFTSGPQCQREVVAHEFFHLAGLVHHYGTSRAEDSLWCAHHMAELVFDIATGETLGCESPPPISCIAPG